MLQTKDDPRPEILKYCFSIQLEKPWDEGVEGLLCFFFVFRGNEGKFIHLNLYRFWDKFGADPRSVLKSLTNNYNEAFLQK